MNSDRKWKFQRFYQARCECNHIAHGQFSLATSYKMYSVSSPTKYGNFIGNLIHISVIRRLFSLTLFRKLKIHQFVKKNSQDAGVNRAKKGYHCIIFFLHQRGHRLPLDCLKLAGISSFHLPTSWIQRKWLCMLSLRSSRSRLHNSKSIIITIIWWYTTSNKYHHLNHLRIYFMQLISPLSSFDDLLRAINIIIKIIWGFILSDCHHYHHSTIHCEQ